MNIPGIYPVQDVKLVTIILAYVRGKKNEIHNRFDLCEIEEMIYLKLKTLKHLILNLVTRNKSKYCNLQYEFQLLGHTIKFRKIRWWQSSFMQ
jgi:hypothetical protein